MDIPAPEIEKLNSDGEPTGAPVVSSATENKSVDSDAINDKKNDTKEDDSATKIVELINSKKYNLNIKEKRTKPLLVVSLGTKKRKQVQKNKLKKDKVPTPKRKKMIEIGAFVLIWAGLYLAIDIGYLDVGWKPPFSLFGGTESGEVSGTTQVEGNTGATPAP